MRSRPRTLPVLCALAASLSSLGCGPETRPGDRPNVVLWVVDTLRADALAPYGNPAVDTPALDRLAAEGTLFEQAYAASSWTRPAMASMLTSTYPEVHGAVQRYDVLQASSTLLSEVMGAHGYRTGLVTANPNIGSSFGFDQGFDDFLELYDPRGTEFVEVRKVAATADDVAAAVVGWLASAPEPYFLVVLSIDPHSPYLAPEEFDRYGGSYAGPANGTHEFINRKNLSEADKARIRSLYQAEVAFSDRALGAVLDQIERAGQRERTVFVYSSDHGEEFWEHGARGHGFSLSEESLHVPLIIRHPPRVPAGERVARAVEVVDLFPTVLDLAGLPLPADLAGRALFADDAGEERRLYASLDLGPSQQVAVRSGGWKLIWDRAGDRWGLYDMSSEAGEARDVSRQNPERLAELTRLARRKHRQNGERFRELHGDDPTRSLAPESLPEGEAELLRQLGYTESSDGDD